MKINDNFEKLVPNYLFADVARKTNEFAKANPDKEIIRLGIGDVTLPLSNAVVDAMKNGCEDLRFKESFKGYPEYEGYDFVRQAVADYYKSFGVNVDYSEVFISDGAKSDCGNIGDIFSKDNIVLVPDPVYPVYVDANIMSGRKIIYAGSSKKNHFLAMPDKNVKADIIYICSPNNPTGAAYNAEQLKEWVNYALENNAVILYDAAYEAFIQDDLHIRSFPKNFQEAVISCMICGTDGRQRNLTEFHGRYSAERQPYSVKKDRNNVLKISFITVRMRR